MCMPGLCDGFVMPPHRREKKCVPVMGRRIVRIKRNCLLEFSLCARPVPVVLSFDPRQRGMRFGECVVYLQRFHGCRFRLGVRSLWRKETKITQNGVAVCQAGISQSVLLIDSNRLLEILKSFFEFFFGPLIPEIAALQISMIGLGVFCVTLCQQPLFFSPEL